MNIDQLIAFVFMAVIPFLGTWLWIQRVKEANEIEK